MSDADVFDWLLTKDRRLLISWKGRTIKVFKRASAERLGTKLRNATPEETQLILARSTGNFRRGNERGNGKRRNNF